MLVARRADRNKVLFQAVGLTSKSKSPHGKWTGDDFNLFRRQPQQAHSRELYERILHAAVSHLNEEGSHTLTTNRIAERAGVDIASLYRYFDIKEAILIELRELESTHEQFTARFWADLLRLCLPGHKRQAESARQEDMVRENGPAS